MGSTPAQPELFRRPFQPRTGVLAVEFRLHCAVANILRQFCQPDWRYTHLPFGEYRTPATARRLKAMGVTPGWPDFMFIGPGRICFLELKRRGGKLAPEQADIAMRLLRAGCGYGMTSDFDDAIGMLKDWGVIPPTVRT